jgi:hypothetical protein
MSPQPGPAAPAKRGTAWLFAIALVVAFVWAVAYLPTLLKGLGHDTLASLSGSNAPMAYGELAGASLGMAAVVWAVLFFAFVRQRNASRGPLYFAIIWAVVFAIDVLGLNLAAAGAARGVADQKTTLNDLHAVVTDIQHGNVGAAGNEIRVTGVGDVGATQALIKQLVNTVANDHQAYQTELNGLGVQDALKPSILAQENLSEAGTRLTQAEAVVAKYRALNDQRLTDFRGAVAASTMTPAAKATFLQSLDASAARDTGRRHQIWDSEAKVVADCADVVQLLGRSRSAWVYQNGNLVFSNPATLATYNNKIVEIQALGAQEKAMQQQNLQDESTRLDAAASQLR